MRYPEATTYQHNDPGGTLVSSTGTQRGDLLVVDGRIVAIDEKSLPRTKFSTPQDCWCGMVDTHVHLMDPGDTAREDFPTGTRAARPWA